MTRAVRRSFLLTLVGLLPLLACGVDEEAADGFEPIFDLAAELAAAEVVAEVKSITFDSPESRRPMRSGWSRNEQDPGRQRGFAWGLGDASLIELPLLAARDLELRLEGRPFVYPGAEPQAVTVVVNGHRVSEIELPPRLTSFTATLPAEALVTGVNQLELKYRWSRSPRQVGQADDRRSLAVAWYEIRCAPGEALAPRAQLGDPPRLLVPFGTEIAYFLEVSPQSELRLPSWTVRGGGGGKLEIYLHGEHEAPERLASFEDYGGGVTLQLPGDRTRIVRLAVRATASAESESKGESGGGILLEGAALWAPALWAPSGDDESPGAAVESSIAGREPSAGLEMAGLETTGLETTGLETKGLETKGLETLERRPNIVLYLIDTLRADHLGAYGYSRPVSPRIDAFAERAVLFEHAVAQSSWTRSSMASIFTGRGPLGHGANGRSDRLSAAAETLPERLRAAGYRTAALITNPNLTAGFGFDQGFDDFTYLTEEAGADEVHSAAVHWLESRAGDEPFFLYLHTLDPHSPYTAPASFRRRLAPGVAETTARRSLDIVDDLQAGRIEVTEALAAELEALYDAEIAFNDHHFGALLDELEERQLFEDSLVILASDHGEEFHEHGNWQHGRALHGESIDVPLIIKLPRDGGGRRVAHRVQQVDLLPTLLAYLGLAAEVELEGRSLLPLMAAEPAVGQHARVFSYLHLDGPARLSVLDGEWKLIQRLEHGNLLRPRLYHLGEDPGERENLAQQYPVRAGYLAALMQAKLAATERSLPREAAAIDDGVRKSLKALGYLD